MKANQTKFKAVNELTDREARERKKNKKKWNHTRKQKYLKSIAEAETEEVGCVLVNKDFQ